MDKIQEGILTHGKRREDLLILLEEAQSELGYLPKELMAELAKSLNIPVNDVYGVASFYAQFRFIKPGEHMIKICLGTACHVRGAAGLVESLERELKVETGKTTADGKFSLEEVRCFGSCALAPVIVVDDQVYGNVTTTKTKEILDDFR